MRSRLRWLPVGVLLGMAPLAAQPGWKPLVGERVPALEAESWLNAGENAPTLDKLKGKVWLLQFFATW